MLYKGSKNPISERISEGISGWFPNRTFIKSVEAIHTSLFEGVVTFFVKSLGKIE